MNRHPLLLVTGVFLAVGLVTTLIGLLPDAPPAPSRTATGAQRPNVPPAGIAKLLATTLPDHANQPQAMSQWAGRVLVVNFWATWCPPCRAEMPDFSDLHHRYAAKGVQFVGIGIDSPSAIKEFALQYPVSYPLLMAGQQGLDLTDALGNLNGALPHTLVIDRQGQAVAERLGRWDAPSLEAVLKGLVE